MVAPRTLATALVVTIALCANALGLAALPTINSGSPPKPQEITGKLETSGVQVNKKAPLIGVDPSQASADLPNVGKSPTTTAAAERNAEKLKRGLTNFMNHLNPAAYFVPPKPAKPVAGAQAEPATIVNDGSSAEVVIKGPNRLVQARQLGGPLRWGRR